MLCHLRLSATTAQKTENWGCCSMLGNHNFPVEGRFREEGSKGQRKCTDIAAVHNEIYYSDFRVHVYTHGV